MQFTTNPKYLNNPLLIKTFEFSVRVINYCDSLEKNKKYAISKQLIRSGTSIGANAKESQNAESSKDFVHKLKIAQKEADETEYWLFLCKELYPSEEVNELIKLLNEIHKLLNSIIAKKRKNMSSNL